MKKGLYRTWTEFEADVALVWTNAMAFNEDGSQVYEDAKILKVWNFLTQYGVHYREHLRRR